MAQYGAARYFPMPSRVLGRNENNNNGFGDYAWPKGVPANLLATASYGDIRVTVRKELVPLFVLLFEITDLMGYKIYTRNPDPEVKESWGPWSYENRPIGGTSSPSNHSRGRAIDVNAPMNPQSKAFVSTWPPEIINRWEQCGFRWGGRYQSPTKYDTMHLNYAGNYDEIEGDIVRARAFRDQLRGSSTPAPTPPVGVPVPGSDGGWPLQPGFYFGPTQGGYSRNGTGNQWERNYVAAFQTRLNALGYSAGAPDGIFGAKTTAAALAWQKRVVETIGAGPRDITLSGLCGSNDYYAIHEALYQVRPAAVVYAPTYPGLLKRGSKGDAVRLMQGRLNEHLKNGYGKSIAVDGDFGPGTEAAVTWFQRVSGRGLDVDGKVGPATWRELWK